jgi:murein tripeptide amidase MpaA
MRVLKLSNGAGKPAIIFDSAIHAREWIGPPTVMWVINELTENLAANQAILDANDFYFIPVTNPDGYEYTWTNVSNIYLYCRGDFALVLR